MIDSCQCFAYVGAVIPRSKVMKSAIISFFKFIKDPGTPASTILRKLVRFFHNKYIFNNKNTFQFEIWPISYLNDSETQERGLKGKISWGRLPPNPR